MCSIQVRLNSPSESVTTISAPARIPGLAFGTMTSKNRRHGAAPSEAALSSSVFTSIAASTGITARTMNGNVKMTCPATMNSHEPRNAPKPP